MPNAKPGISDMFKARRYKVIGIVILKNNRAINPESILSPNR